MQQQYSKAYDNLPTNRFKTFRDVIMCTRSTCSLDHIREENKI